jgi:activator of HSP90 ATPase
METRDLHHKVILKTGPNQAYEAIVDPKKHSDFTDSPAENDGKVGGEHSAFDGYCFGENVELSYGKRIVQTWQADEDGWPEDHFSKIIYEFTAVPGGTLLTFKQLGVPEEVADSIDQGWIDYYWEPLKAYFED